LNLGSIINGIIGITVIIIISFCFSNQRKKINWSLVAKGLLLQFLFAFFIIKGNELGQIFYPLGLVKLGLEWVGNIIVLLLQFTLEGSQFVFGPLGSSSGEGNLGFIFAFQALSTIVFVSSVTSLLYHFGILQRVVQVMAFIMVRILGTSGAESLTAAANIFVGQTEAPLLIKPYINKMTRSEILTIMTSGMATIAGGVMAAYIAILGQSLAMAKGIDINTANLQMAIHLLAASTMAAPGVIVITKILYPETEEPLTKGNVKVHVERDASNFIESTATGALEGVKLAINVAAMLIAFIALVALLNHILFYLGDITGLNNILIEKYDQALSFQFILGIILQFVAFIIGVPWQDAMHFGSLIGTKVVLNEFVAYLDLSTLIAKNALSDKTIVMASYALCGFANFSSIAIQIAGIGGLAPNKKKDIAELGLKALLGGTLTTLITATIGGMIF
jgi:CNT family concentrative nucleoside transporter